MRLITLKPERSLGHDPELRNGLRPLHLLSNTLLCGFRAVCALRAYYPTDLARGIRPFVDLLLTRLEDSKKRPVGRRACH